MVAPSRAVAHYAQVIWDDVIDSFSQSQLIL